MIHNFWAYLGGRMGTDTMSHAEPFVWSEAGKNTPRLQRYLEKEIFPLLPSEARVFILRTEPGKSLAPHIDTSPDEMGSMQEKLRVALSGKIDGLYFFDEHFEKVYVLNKYRVYVLDGGHAHAVESSPEEKMTICIGSPWRGPLSEFGEHKLIASEALHLSRSMKLPEKWVEAKYYD